MNIQTDKAYTVFRNAVADKVYYKLGLSHKKLGGTYENGYITVQFKSGVDIPNATKIYLKQAWLTFYKKKVVINGYDYWDTIPYIFINEFTTMQEQIDQYHVDFDKIDEKKSQESQKAVEDPFVDFSQEITINESDLSF